MNQTTFTRGPVAWQQFGENYCLTGQYRMRPIILSANIRGKLKLRDAARDLLVDFDPAHPDAQLIVAAFNAATAAQDMGFDGIKAVEALPKLLEALQGCLLQLEGPALVYGDGRGNDGRKTGLSGEEFNKLRHDRVKLAHAALAQAGQKPRGKDYDTPEGA